MFVNYLVNTNIYLDIFSFRCGSGFYSEVNCSYRRKTPAASSVTKIKKIALDK